MSQADSTSQATADKSQTAKKSPRKISRQFVLAVCLLLLLSMCVFWLISSYNTQNLLRQQADQLGQTLAQQTSIQLTELVLSNDLISMNVVLSSLTANSTIADISVLNVDRNVIATATGTPEVPSLLIPLPIPLSRLVADYVAPITLADSVAGYVQVRLDLSYIEAGIINNLLLVAGATLLLLVVAALLTSLYYQYLVSFPANLLAFSLSNIRKGEIEICPEPKNNSEISTAIRQFNTTAEFLAQNTFLSNFGKRQPEADTRNFKAEPGKQDTTLLAMQLANFHYLASTRSEETMVNLLNKYYFFAGKVGQLYNGSVSYCADGEVLINFGDIQIEEEQAFYAICAGQLFLQLVGDLNDVGGEQVAAKFRLAVHSGQTVSGLYSPITQTNNNLTGHTLDLVRAICKDCPDNSLLISATSFNYAGAGSRVEAEEYREVEDGEPVMTFLALESMSDYKLLLERQAIQLVTLYSD
jgi:uncharacterized membrane protein affecting hemolysin expression/class 3 adenylate cyclase